MIFNDYGEFQFMSIQYYLTVPLYEAIRFFYLWVCVWREKLKWTPVQRFCSLLSLKVTSHPHMAIFASASTEGLCHELPYIAEILLRAEKYALKCLSSTETGTQRTKQRLPTGLINNKKLQGVHQELCLPSSRRDACKRFLPLMLPSMKRVSQSSDIFSTFFIRWQCDSSCLSDTGNHHAIWAAKEYY